jgi:uncharacterized membrane protein
MSGKKEPGVISLIFFAGAPGWFLAIAIWVGVMIWLFQQAAHLLAWIWHTLVMPHVLLLCFTVTLSVLIYGWWARRREYR